MYLLNTHTLMVQNWMETLTQLSVDVSGICHFQMSSSDQL